MSSPVRPDVVAADFVALATEHHGAIYRTAYRLCGSVADAEDLTQQTFLTAYRCRDQLREPAAARAWLAAILRSCFLKSLRRRRPTAAVDRDLELDALPGPAVESTTVDSERLQLALNELSPDARLILTMFYFDEASYREIAATLDLPLGTVMSRLSRAKEQLRLRLDRTATLHGAEAKVAAANAESAPRERRSQKVRP